MNKEFGLFIIKPDGILLGEEIPVIEAITSCNLEIKLRKEIIFSEDQVKEFYSDKVDELSQYFPPYLCSRPSVLLVVEGENANDKIGDIKKQMRTTFSHDKFYTGTHCSDNETEAKQELKILKVTDLVY